MLLIDCPYCGERPEPEFVYGGQAHIARPARRRRRSRRGSGPTISTCATTPAGCMPSAGGTPTAAAASSTRCATPPPTSSSQPTRWAKTPPRRRAGALMIDGLRLAHGGRIDRTRALRFTFDGRAYGGFAGDTLASALLANGVHLMGRSFKYHRPRGVLAAGAEEPNALVAVRRDAARYTPNLRATQVELYEGLEAHSQNRWPSLSFDVGAVNDLLAPFIPGGLLLQNVHVAERRMEVALRAAHPRGGGLRQRADAGRSRSLRRALRTLRRAGRRRRPRRSRRGRPRPPPRERASCCAMSSPSPAARCSHTIRALRDLIDGRPAAEWLARTLARRSRPMRA